MVEGLVWLGSLVFAATGALKGVEKGFDLLGVLVLATVTAVGGGSIRDVLVGTLPPSALRNEPLLWSVVLTGLLVFRFHPRVQALERPIYYLDTLGLGLFAALGAERGLQAGFGPFGVALAGTLGQGVGSAQPYARLIRLLEAPRVHQGRHLGGLGQGKGQSAAQGLSHGFHPRGLYPV